MSDHRERDLCQCGLSRHAHDTRDPLTTDHVFALEVKITFQRKAERDLGHSIGGGLVHEWRTRQ